MSLCFEASEKRPLEDSSSAVDNKRRKVDGDIGMNVVAEIVETITEPDRMLGPHVSITLTMCNISQSAHQMVLMINAKTLPLCYHLCGD